MTDDRLLAAKKKFSRLLKEIFQFDCADLDFGIYRILAMRRAELERFLDDELLPQVEGILAAAAGDRASVQSELSKLESTLRDAGIQDFSSSPKWNELKGKLAASPDVAALAREVFSDLTTFFARYYDEGDFMALPRYKGDTYAIPYDGSEVKLHWANADQYYIKTTEQHADYTAVIDGVSGLDKPRLCFRLAAAESDRDNNKSTEKRRYLLRGESPVEVEGNQLTLWFEYRVPDPGNGRQPTQSALCEQTEKTVLAAVPQAWQAVLTRKASQTPEKYTVLGYQLYRYTKKNTSDYFIHKDLGGFLRRELDFFIKNEVLFLDDIEGRTSAELEVALQKVKAIRAVGGKIIDWLAQIENFQRKLFLKRKFILYTEWIGTADVVSPELRVRVGHAEPALARWRDLGFTDNQETRHAAPIETSYVPTELRRELEIELMQVGEPAGLLICGDNLQALRLIRPCFEDSVACVFIDPPYNTGNDGFLYKDAYRHSTWLSMFTDRIRAARSLMKDSGVLFFSLDEEEAPRAWLAAEAVFGPRNFSSELVWEKKKKPSFLHRNLGKVTDFIFAFTRNYEQSPPFSVETTTAGKMTPLNNAGNAEGVLLFPAGRVEFGCADGVFEPQDMSEGRIKTTLMDRVQVRDGRNTDPFRLKGEFRYSQARLDDVCASEDILYISKAPFRPNHIKSGGEIKKMKNILSPKHYQMETNEDASQQVTDLFGSAVFTTAKPEKLVRYLVRAVTHSEQQATVLDFFAGSGTTAQATLNQNREDGGQRKFILIEGGAHFDTATRPRVLKAIAGTEWTNGSLQSISAHSGTYKAIYLESYDDALENIELVRPDAGELFERSALREDYTLRYMLNLESEGSLLSLERFSKPWDYTIKVRRDGVVQDSPVDLVETFNYLIGLRVRRYDTYGQEGLLFVIGTDPDGRRVIIVWRDCDLWPNDRLEEKCRQAFESFRPDEFDLVYVNGDNHLPIIKTGEESWKVNLIEETFHARMFDTSDVE